MNLQPPSEASDQSKHSQRRWWTRRRLVGLMIVVMSFLVWRWNQGPKLSLREELILSAKAEGLETIEFNHQADAEPEPQPPPYLTMDELESLAAEGELVLYAMRGRPVTWLEMTGVSFAKSVQAARELDRSLTDEDHQ